MLLITKKKNGDIKIMVFIAKHCRGNTVTDTVNELLWC